MKVDFINNKYDLQVILLGSLGFSTDYIQSKVRNYLSKNQIMYRLRKGGCKRSDYRNGVSSISKLVLNQTESKIV
jgi:hypothetical protein